MLGPYLLIYMCFFFLILHFMFRGVGSWVFLPIQRAGLLKLTNYPFEVDETQTQEWY